MGWSIVIGVAAAAFAPWVDRGIAAAGLLLLANAGAMVYAVVWSAWVVKEVHGWQKLMIIYPLIVTTGIAMVVVWGVFVMSLTLRS